MYIFNRQGLGFKVIIEIHVSLISLIAAGGIVLDSEFCYDLSV